MRQAKFIKLYAAPSPWDFVAEEEKQPRLLWIAERLRDDIWSIAYSRRASTGQWQKYTHVNQWATKAMLLSENFVFKWEYATTAEVFAEIL